MTATRHLLYTRDGRYLKMDPRDEKWLDERYLAYLDYQRTICDLDGWHEVPVKTFAGGHSAPWVDGEVTEDDASVAAGIRARVWRAKGSKETR